MTCKWFYEDCSNEDTNKCILCVSNGLKYEAKKIKKTLSYNVNKKDKRKGSKFEYANHLNNKEVLSSMTLNSGATVKEKGDEQIKGIINVMEELKTQDAERIRGTKSFNIQRKWLDKLHMEANKENKEFWYLKFAFSEDEVVHQGGGTFVITEQDIIMSMIKTMVIDRKKSKKATEIIDLYKKKYNRIESELVYKNAKIEELETEIKCLENKDIKL